MESAGSPARPSGSGRVQLAQPQTGPIAIGRNLGGYELVKKLGSTTSSVFLARDSQGAFVALKILPQQLVTRAPNAGKRFLREARALFGLNHPSVIRLLNAGEELGTYYLAMEYFDGPTCKDYLAQQGGRVPEDVVYSLAAQAAQGLAYLHEQGLVHRNVKPEHLLINGAGQLKLIGLGLVRESEDDSNRVTMKGAILGSPQYMAPEQARALELDGRADLYSLGVTIYELASGTVPFPEKSAARVLQRLAQDVPPPLRDRNPNASAQLERVVARLLAKAPDDRYPDAAGLATDLASLARGGPLTHLDRLEGVEEGDGDAGRGPSTQSLFIAVGVLAALVVLLMITVVVLLTRLP